MRAAGAPAATGTTAVRAAAAPAAGKPGATATAATAGTDEQPTLYFKRGCSGCERARRWLAQHGIRVREREIFRQPLSASEIEDVVGDEPIALVLSTRTKAFAARGLDRSQPSEAELLRHMEAEPRLLRRPLLRYGGEVLVGFDPARWAAALGVEA